jgi:hypothetical protein
MGAYQPAPEATELTMIIRWCMGVVLPEDIEQG